MERITSRTNERVKELALLAASAKERRRAGLCVLDGVKLCREAAARGLLRELWVTDEVLCALEQPLLPEEATVLVSPEVAAKLSSVQSSQGMVGVAALPPVQGMESLAQESRVVVLCGIQDPANVGTSIRTAAAFGFGGALLCGPCADPFSPKALRASMGAAFTVRLVGCDEPQQAVAALGNMGFRTVAFMLDDGAVPVDQLPAAPRTALLIGNEGHGLPEEVRAACDASAYIPITHRVESLNAGAAAAVAMWVLRP